MGQFKSKNNPQFKPSQIVCLEHQKTCLYSEVIQVIAQRNLCWVRPLVLIIIPRDTSSGSNFLEPEKLFDLRQGSDILWPISLFRLALDTEIIPLLVKLETQNSESENIQNARQELNNFIDRVWQAHKSDF